MYVDLSQLESLGKTAVRCKTEEFAQTFVDAMWEQYPEKMDGIWARKNHNNWHHYAHDQNGICYLHRITYKSDGVDYCQSTSFENAVRYGYIIVEFEELIRASCDFGEILQSEMDIKNLFEAG